MSEGLEDDGDLQSLGAEKWFALAETVRQGSGEESLGLSTQKPPSHTKERLDLSQRALGTVDRQSEAGSPGLISYIPSDRRGEYGQC